MNKKIAHFDFLAISLYLAIATIPLSNNLNSRMIILFCILGAINNNIQQKKKLLKRNLSWVLSALFFFILFLSVFWDPNGINALKSIEKKVSFLVLPLILASIPQFNKKVFRNAFFVFIVSTLVVCLYSLAKSTAEYFIIGDYRIFFYHYLSKQVKLNAVYLSLYCLFSLCVLIHYYFVKPDPFSFIPRSLAILFCLMFSGFLILLSSKMVIFIAFLVILISVLYITYKRGRLFLGALLILLIVGLGGVAIQNLHYLRWRINVTLVKKYEDKSDNQNGFAIRQKLWEISARLIKERPILGYGVMYTNERLVEEYRKENFLIAAENKYNSHNVYLQTLLNAGILSILPLITLFITSIIIAIQRRSYLFFVFLFIIALLGITEALFDGQKGVVFFVLFLFLFIYHNDSQEA